MYPFQMALWAIFRADSGSVFGAEKVLLNCHPVLLLVVLGHLLEHLVLEDAGLALQRRDDVLAVQLEHAQVHLFGQPVGSGSIVNQVKILWKMYTLAYTIIMITHAGI